MTVKKTNRNTHRKKFIQKEGKEVLRWGRNRQNVVEVNPLTETKKKSLYK